MQGMFLDRLSVIVRGVLNMCLGRQIGTYSRLSDVKNGESNVLLAGVVVDARAPSKTATGGMYTDS